MTFRYADPEINLRGGVAIERQIETQLRDFVLSGRLQPGEELPTVRAMAVALGVNPEAVERAYSQLENEAILTSSEGSGVFVADQGARASAVHGNRGALETLCADLLRRAGHLGFSSEEVISQLRVLSNQVVSA